MTSPMKPSSNKQDRSGFGLGTSDKVKRKKPTTDRAPRNHPASLPFTSAAPQNLKVSPSPASGVAGATSEAFSAAA
jgi:hypothetical protein